MYEQTGRYYAFFGPQAVVTPEEERFLSHWTAGRRRALDLGAGLCGPATMLARLGLEVLAFEPSPILASLAMDRLNRGDEIARSVTLVEGPVEAFAEPFAADVILIRSVLMLLSDAERSAVLEAARRHTAARATLIVDVRTAALPWADEGVLPKSDGSVIWSCVAAQITRVNGTVVLVFSGGYKPIDSGAYTTLRQRASAYVLTRRTVCANCCIFTASRPSISTAVMTSTDRIPTEVR